jgi:hypothetical protein
MHRPIPGFTFRPSLKGRIHRHAEWIELARRLPDNASIFITDARHTEYVAQRNRAKPALTDRTV